MKSSILALALALPLCAADMNVTNLTGDPPGTVIRFGNAPSIIYSNGYAVINMDVPTLFSLTLTNTEVDVVTNKTPQTLKGRFGLEWVVETNTYTPRTTMTGFAWPAPTNYWGGNLYLTNVMSYNGIVYSDPPAPTEGTETYYVSSNLFFHVVWRDRTNSDCLESVPVRTEVRRWKIEQKKVYTP